MNLPAIHLKDSSLKFLKYLAAVLMFFDHANKYIFSEKYTFLFDAGRVAMPLFVFVLAYNLARFDVCKDSVIFKRVFFRVLSVGAVSTVPFIALNELYKGWFPLNIFFMFSVALGACFFLARSDKWAKFCGFCVWLLGSIFVEFWWPATGLFIACWLYCRNPSVLSLAFALVFLSFGLSVINSNYWALMVLPLIFASKFVSFELPRAKWFFYSFYPLHLAGIWLFLNT